MRARGFTLLEVLVATFILGLAVVGLLSNLGASMRNASRLIEYDRAAILARQKMDELLLAARLPSQATLEGAFGDAVSGGLPAGWRARVTPFEAPPDAPRGFAILERIELEVWWGEEAHRRSVRLEAFRRGIVPLGAPGEGHH